MLKKLLLSIITLFLLCCKQTDSPPVKMQPLYKEAEPPITPQDREEITEEESLTYHVDEEHLYKYRTGISGQYEYNYDIVGHDKDSNEVRGNINIRGKYGAGIVVNAQGEEKELHVEWVDYGKLAGTDEDGKEYKFKVE